MPFCLHLIWKILLRRLVLVAQLDGHPRWTHVVDPIALTMNRRRWREKTETGKKAFLFRKRKMSKDEKKRICICAYLFKDSFVFIEYDDDRSSEYCVEKAGSTSSLMERLVFQHKQAVWAERLQGERDEAESQTLIKTVWISDRIAHWSGSTVDIDSWWKLSLIKFFAVAIGIDNLHWQPLLYSFPRTRGKDMTMLFIVYSYWEKLGEPFVW